ncbi:MAG: hypothetical protein ACXABD_17225 [Candidatus Thorarchaeota archaeon]|jgi:hypothetical protein
MAELQPHTVAAPPARRDFLRTGHYLQRQVEDILREEGVVLLGTEGEGIHNCCGDFEIVGHVDGILDLGDTTPSLLEVKAIQHKNFMALKQLADWREKYGYNVPQAQCYLAFPDVYWETTKGKEYIGGPFQATYFIYFDRDTSDMLGGLMLDRPNYEYRPDMILQPSLHEFNDILHRHREAYTHIINETIPDYCDKEGYCFFCKRGIPKKDPRK